MTTTILPAGTYLIGDPAHFLPDEHADNWINRDDDDYTATVPGPDGVEHPFVAFCTVNGDGVYQDQDGREYPVNSGDIGALDIRAADPRAQERGYVTDGILRQVTFDTPVEARYEQAEGTVIFGGIRIPTDPYTDQDGE